MSKTRANESLHQDGLSGMPVHRLRRHAEQLATHLGAVANDLDRREAQIATERAHCDGQLRAARLWIDARVAQLREMVMHAQQQVGHLQFVAQQTAPEQSDTLARTERNFEFTTCARQLELLNLQLTQYEKSSIGPLAEYDTAKKLNRRTMALDFREQSIKLQQRALAEAYQETMAIRDSVERLLHQKLRHGPSPIPGSADPTDEPPDREQTQALRKAEKRLRTLYTQVRAQRSHASAVKKMDPPAWMQERQALIGEINRLRAKLERSGPDALGQKAA